MIISLKRNSARQLIPAQLSLKSLYVAHMHHCYAFGPHV